ncbi:MAG: cytochrome P450 [Myxococcales bacterium]|nr:cytochrome P450 [Myxococcales bacterium]
MTHERVAPGVAADYNRPHRPIRQEIPRSMSDRPRYARYSRWRLLRALVSGWNRRMQVALDISGQADVVEVPLPGKRIFVLTHPDDIRRVLLTEREKFPKSYDYDVLRQYMGDGLVTSAGERWEADRKLLHPAFSNAATQPLRPMIESEVQRVGERWRGLDTPLDPFAEMTTLTITVMGRRLLGCDLSRRADEIRHAIDTCGKQAVRRAQAPVDWVRWFRTPAERRAQRARASLRAIIDDARRNGGASERVSTLLEESGRSTEESLDQLVTLFAAGYDTTGNALAWCLYELAKNPGLQERVRAGVAGESGDEVLAALVQETLRFYPTVPGVGRVCPEGAEWDDVALPAGATLFVFFYGMHHRPDLFVDPERFWPERFLGVRRESLPRRAYVPFGAGPRICIGSHFATQELQVALGHLIPRFRLELADPAPIRPVPGISLTPSRSLRLYARPIEG